MLGASLRAVIFFFLEVRSRRHYATSALRISSDRETMLPAAQPMDLHELLLALDELLQGVPRKRKVVSGGHPASSSLANAGDDLVVP